MNNFIKNLKTYLVLSLFMSFLISCYDREIISSPDQIINPVDNLAVELQGDTAILTWSNTQDTDGLKANITYNGGVEIIEANQETFSFGIIDVNKEYLFTVKLSDTKGNYSLGKTVNLLREGPNAVLNLIGTQNGKDLILNWELPEQSIDRVELKIDDNLIVLPSTATSYTVENAELKKYNIKVNLYDTSGLISPTSQIDYKIGSTLIAYIGESANFSLVTDDDEIASGTWLFENYPDAEYVSFDDIKSGIDLNKYRVLWFHYDNQNNDPSLPQEAQDPIVINAVKEFHKNGGGLFLNTHAVQYLWTIGRMTSSFSNVIGAGSGFDNPDVWGVNVTIGKIHDESTHPLYKNLVYNEVDGKKLIPLIGSGWKEDHNYVYNDLPSYYGLGNSDEAAYAKISSDNNIKILGTWDGINDYWMMGMFETLPNDEFSGTSIALGLGSYEWNQNNVNNTYQSNIELIAKNALEYLKTK